MKLKLSVMTSEAISPVNQVFTSTLGGKYLKIHTYGAKLSNEGSAIVTTAITDHNSPLQE